MPSASFAVRSCRPGALLLLAVVCLASLAGLMEVSASKGGPKPLAAPVILSTSPTDGSLGILSTALLQVRFSAPMNESSVNGSLFIQPPVLLNISWPSFDQLILTPGPQLTNCTVYTVTVGTGPTGGKDLNDTSLVPGPVPNPWRFMTACNAPFILSTDPPDGDRNVRPTADLVITFSKPMDCGSALSVTFNPPLPLPAQTLTWCDATQTIFTSRFNNGTEFTPGLRYNATITGQDLNGTGLVNGLVPNPWSFIVNAPPVVSQPFLDRTACLDAQSTVAVSWNMSDDQQAPQDLTTQVRVIVSDASGGTAANVSGWFRIDTGAPFIGARGTSPLDGAIDVPTNGPITSSFS